MDISVALATYNGARYLSAQLESLAQQTAKPAELVVCDDESSDATPEIVKKFARTAPFPVLFQANPTRLHFADNFLKAASLCSSDYIAFCDQDDVWRPHKLATVTKTVLLTDACLVAHNATKINAAGRPLGRLRQTNQDGLLTGADLHPWGFFYGFTCTFSRQLLELVPGEDRPIDPIDPRRRLAHDRWVAFLASIYGDIFVLNEPLADYRHHGANASGWMQSRRGMAASWQAARQKFGYHLLKQLLIAQNLVRVLGSMAADPSRLTTVPSSRRLIEMLAYWRLFEERCAARYAITQRDTWDQRLRPLGRAVANHAYRSAVHGSVDYRTFAVDVMVSILARPGQREYAESLLGASPRPEAAAS